MEELTEKQKLILNFIKKEIKTKGIPPTVREICSAAGLSSTSSVHSHLIKLEEMGYILRSDLKNRHIEILEENFYTNFEEIVQIPILGDVSAGIPMFAEENIEGYFPLPAAYLKRGESFVLRVKGNSMINAGILNNDLVIVKKQSFAENGDIVIALADDFATCKRYFLEKGKITLKPENDEFEPITSDNIIILGKVTGLFRNI